MQALESMHLFLRAQQANLGCVERENIPIVERLLVRDLFTIVLSPFGIHLVNLYDFLHHYFGSSVS